MRKLEIEIPDNKEIDWEASAKQKQVIFKDKPLSYEDVCKKLFDKPHAYYTDGNGVILKFAPKQHQILLKSPNNATSEHQLKCLLVKNKLANVAVYLNNGWKPNVEIECCYCIALDCYNSLAINHCGVLCEHSSGKVIFKSEELAQQAIEILGEDAIRLALEPLY